MQLVWVKVSVIPTSIGTCVSVSSLDDTFLLPAFPDSLSSSQDRLGSLQMMNNLVES